MPAAAPPMTATAATLVASNPSTVFMVPPSMGTNFDGQAGKSSGPHPSWWCRWCRCALLRLVRFVSRAQLRYHCGMWKQHEQSGADRVGGRDTSDERAGPARGLGSAGAEAAACLECGNRLARRRRCLYQSQGSVVL